MVDLEDYCCDNAEGGHEDVRTLIIAGMGTPPVFEPSEHDLDFVALAVDPDIARDMDFSV